MRTMSKTRSVTAPIVSRIFDRTRWQAEQPLRIVFIGSDFETRVWQTLLKIPMGRATTYSDIASHIGNAKSLTGRRYGRGQESHLVCSSVSPGTGKVGRALRLPLGA